MPFAQEPLLHSAPKCGILRFISHRRSLMTNLPEKCLDLKME